MQLWTRMYWPGDSGGGKGAVLLNEPDIVSALSREACSEPSSKPMRLMCRYEVVWSPRDACQAGTDPVRVSRDLDSGRVTPVVILMHFSQSVRHDGAEAKKLKAVHAYVSCAQMQHMD